MKSIAYYITAHGYGHGTRSCDVLCALNRLRPDLPVTVITDLPRDFLYSRLAGCANLMFRSGAFDTGLVQQDSLRSDLSKTLEKLSALYDREEALIEQERRFITETGVRAVAADIPAIPLAAAQRAGVPDIAIGNFSWDWIYADYATHDPRWPFFAQKFRSVYQQTGLLLRLPFAPPMEQFPNRRDIPLLASPGKSRRKKLAALSGAHIGRPWVLLSFTSLNLDAAALARIAALSDAYEFFCVQPMAFPGSCIRAIDRHEICFADILASCDIVISKPGFGLVSECIVNRKPLIYTDRGDFAEYPYLVVGIETYLQNVHIPSAQLYAGELGPYLKTLKTAPLPAEQMAFGGAEMIAKELIAHAS